MNQTISTLNLVPLSPKHIEYCKKAMLSKVSVGEGAIRSGKTIDNCIIFSLLLCISRDKIHLASGSTLPNAKLNIGECNGFGLEHIFSGRCRWGKFKENDCLYITIPSGEEKIVIFAGGGKADSYKKILGNSYGLWIATEINEHYDSDDSKTSFIKVAMGRQVASYDPHILWDLNPDNPNAKIYTDYIDNWKENGLIGGYNYQHFTLEDNSSLTEQRKEEIKSQYKVGSIWYLRDILGKRVITEGIIYQEFNEHHIIKMSNWLDNELRKQIQFISVGVDFGGSTSAHSFIATGILKGFKGAVVLKQTYIHKRIDDVELTKAFIDFIQSVRAEYEGINIIDIRCDSAEQTLIAGFQRALREHNIGIPINNAIKGKILNRIRFSCKMFSTNKIYILECCDNLINAIRTAIWEKGKVDVRLDDGIQDVDSLDSYEYSLEPYMEALIQIN